MALGIYNTRKKDWLVFCLGLFTMIKVRFLGTFGVSELFMICLLVFKSKDAHFFRNKDAKLLFNLALLWLFGTIATDLLRDSGSVDMLKGIFSIVFLILILPASYWCLYDKIERVLYYVAGLSLSAIIGFKFQQSVGFDEYEMDVWQVYAFEYLAVFVASLMFYKRKSAIGYSVLISYGAWSLFHQSRNVFLLFVISSVTIFVMQSYMKNNHIPHRVAQKRFNNGFIKLLVVLSLTFWGIKGTYEHYASNGTLGERAKNKYESQKNSSMGLVSGRGDFFITLKMIKESPIIGYGSYAKDKNELAYQKAKELGFKSDLEYSQQRIRRTLIPGHSYILGAWVYNGILGLPFWIFSIWLIFKFIFHGLYSDVKLSPLLIIWSAIFMWNILFSPFANRAIIAMLLSALIVTLKNSDTKSINPLKHRIK